MGTIFRRLALGALLCTALLVPQAPPAAAAVGDITPYTDVNLTNPRDIVLGPDGNLWFTSFQTARVGKITPAGVITMYTDANLVSPQGITVGPDGALWFTDFGGGRIGRITTAGAITTFPDGNISGAQDIVTGPDGNLWFTANLSDRVGKITPAGVITTFPSADIDGPFDIATNGIDLYFTNFDGDSFGKVTTAGTVTEINLAGLDMPTGLTYVPEDGIFAFVSTGNDALGVLAPGASPVALFLGPPMAGSLVDPIQLTVGPDDLLWITSAGSGGDVDRYNSSTNTFEPVADAESEIGSPWGITTGSDGNVWFTDVATSSVDRIEVDSTPPEITITTPADGAVYQRNQSITADFDCSDPGSGVVSCTASDGGVADGDPIFLETPGAYEFEVEGVDTAGNTATETVSFTVASPVCAGRTVTVDLNFDDLPTGGNDVILGTPGAETIDTLGGNDLVCAGGGADTVFGRAGSDKLYGGPGADLLFGHAGNDKAYGGDGNDTLNGAAGLDVLEGGNQNDTLNGGTQRDVCKGQAGTRDRGISCEVRSGIP